ncbi:hypothetical protein [Dolichospermum compactum]|uniref:Transposase n=1 Tax=Dolichospermum compactum NIES-806 TaxID=1973481 RepID=A0A1Z4V0V3_9CYAN|nr:hypothetical protein [Dolichospermum compactum]BAZ85063.1 transposase [Dolichospermum compactum NIES-806]
MVTFYETLSLFPLQAFSLFFVLYRDIEITEKTPNIKEENKSKYYQISATVDENKDVIEQEMVSAGRFIIATNVLCEKELSNEKMLSEYKAQQSCELVILQKFMFQPF